MNSTLREILGWTGAASLLIAYSLVNFGIFSVHSLVYLLLNIIGAVGIIIVSIHDKAYQPALVNIIWLLIALVGIVRFLF